MKSLKIESTFLLISEWTCNHICVTARQLSLSVIVLTQEFIRTKLKIFMKMSRFNETDYSLDKRKHKTERL